MRLFISPFWFSPSSETLSSIPSLTRCLSVVKMWLMKLKLPRVCFVPRAAHIFGLDLFLILWFSCIDRTLPVLICSFCHIARWELKPRVCLSEAANVCPTAGLPPGSHSLQCQLYIQSKVSCSSSLWTFYCCFLLLLFPNDLWTF